MSRSHLLKTLARREARPAPPSVWSMVMTLVAVAFGARRSDRR